MSELGRVCVGATGQYVKAVTFILPDRGPLAFFHEILWLEGLGSEGSQKLHGARTVRSYRPVKPVLSKEGSPGVISQIQCNFYSRNRPEKAIFEGCLPGDQQPPAPHS